MQLITGIVRQPHWIKFMLGTANCPAELSALPLSEIHINVEGRLLSAPPVAGEITKGE